MVEYAMSLNIKDPEAHALAQQLAQRTGETLTRAVTEALRERLARVNRVQGPDATAADLLSIGRRCAAMLTQPPVDHAELLYDEHGLPQ